MKAWKALPFDEEHYRETEVGSVVADGRAGLTRAGADVGAAYAGCAWDAGRIYWGGGEDGDSGEGGGEGEHAAGAGYDAGGELCEVQEVCGVDLSRRGCVVEVRLIHSAIRLW